MTDLEGLTIYTNQAFHDLVGYEAEELYGTHFLARAHPDDLALSESLWKRQIETGESYRMTRRYVRKDGDVVWADVSSATVPATSYRPAFSLSLVQDTTEQRRADQALRESEARYRTLVEHAPEAIVVFDLEAGRFVDANDNAVELFDIDRERLLRVGPADVSPPEQPNGRRSAEAAMEYMWAAAAGETPVFEWTYCSRRGQRVPCEVRLVRLPASEGLLVRGSITDITRRKQLEEELRQAQKMEAVGRLAGGIAHDFNNLLTAISGNCALLLEDIDEDSPLRESAVDIADAAERAAALTAQLLAFSRRQVLRPTLVDLSDMVERTAALLRRLLAEHIQLEVRTEPELGSVRADPGQLGQVLLNLALNARDAMPNGGTLTISTANVGGEEVELVVSDTGVGMDEATQARIFEPFFTTKDVGEGTGLGLATVYGIVEQSGGHIALQSRPGQGTSVRVLLPRVDAPAESAREQPGAVGAGGSETVLLVEDDAAVLRLARRALEGGGYRVLEARNGAEAADIAARYDDEIHLVLTDVVMPEMSGVTLAERVMRLRPGTRVLFMSGYSDEAVDAPPLPQADLITKPFRPGGLLRKVRELLDAPAAEVEESAPQRAAGRRRG